MINILLVDDHPMVLAGMEAIFLGHENYVVKGKAQTAFEALAILKRDAIDLVITDIHLPEINGIDLCKKISKEFPKVKIVGMSTFSDKSYVSSMIQHGASGYLTKTAGIEEIFAVLDSALRNEINIKVSDLNSNTFKTSSPIPIITTREKEILLLISQGFTNKEIADQLYVSVNTVDSHRKNLLTKFNVQNSASLIASAGKFGYLE
ncbi:MAG: response regulator transcription factor [Chitinophagaceae bacterium]|nr:response regulator transcription factor [Chitinophagaceae bacterium]